MWQMKKGNEHVFYIRADKFELVVGRSGEVCDLVLTGDASVSRRHAMLQRDNDLLSLQDLGSKYGTFLNENIEKKVSLPSQESVLLNPGDKIRFGTLDNTWTIHKLNLVTCTSTMKGENLEAMKKDLDIIGASLCSEWDNTCTHLTMPAITLTAKVLAALAFGCHIVTVDYWKQWRVAVTEGGNPPNPSDYLPEIIENTLNKENISFAPDTRRSQIFLGKKLIFFSRKQMNFYRMVLERCGATVALMSECKLTKSKLCADNILVVQYSGAVPGQESQSQRQAIGDIVSYMAEKSHRIIPDIEIGLAVLLISTEQYCNPKKIFLHIFNKSPVNPIQTETGKILAPETQEIDLESNKDKSGVVIDESLESTNKEDGNSNEIQEIVRNKRKLHDTDDNFSSMYGLKKQDISGASDRARTIENDMFDFLDEAPKSTSNKLNKSPSKKLNFLKPKNRKNEHSKDDIFNFVTDTKDTEVPKLPLTNNSNQSSLFNLSSNKKRKPQDSELPAAKKSHIETSVSPILYDNKSEITQLLKNTFWKSCADEISKQEIVKQEAEELNELKVDMGTTIVNVCTNLIVKTEMPVLPRDNSYSGPNFKKFRKVLPLRMQVTVIPSSSMSIYRSENAAQPIETHSCDEDDAIIWNKNTKKGKKQALR